MNSLKSFAMNCGPLSEIMACGQPQVTLTATVACEMAAALGLTSFQRAGRRRGLKTDVSLILARNVTRILILILSTAELSKADPKIMSARPALNGWTVLYQTSGVTDLSRSRFVPFLD